MTLYLHEVHAVRGTHEEEFEAAFRDPDGWMDVLGRDGDARLLYYTNQAHGTGLSYRVVTITAVADGAAWERLSRRVDGGDLAKLALRTDGLRHRVDGKLLMPVAWSPLKDLDLATIPSVPADHECTLFMEDTGWPSSTIDAYIDFWEKDYNPMLVAQAKTSRLLEIQACWTMAYGSGRRPEGVLWQRIHSFDRLMALYSREIPPAAKNAGGYMERALSHRDQWESRLLRTSPWSPLS